MNLLDTKIAEFKLYYETQLDYNTSALKAFDKLIETLPGVERVTSRIKDYDECISKFKRKYLPTIAPGNATYKIADYLNDFFGIRVICLYLEDIPLVRKSLQKYFREIEIDDKSNQMEITDDKFGYKSLHLDLMLNPNKRLPNKLKSFYNMRFELQVRTIIQDSWSVLDHKIKYKKSIPQGLKRRINRLSALFEIADDEFLNIKREIDKEEKQITKRLKQGDKVEKDKPLDVFRFLFIALKYFPDYNFLEFKVDGFVQEILNMKKTFTESEMNDALLNYLHLASEIAAKEGRPLNPYTKIRYCLFFYNQKVFLNILSTYQKESIAQLNHSAKDN